MSSDVSDADRNPDLVAAAGSGIPGGIVDSHQHFWDLAAHDQPWLRMPGNEPLLRNYSEADLRPLAEAAGVTATIVVQTVIEPGETPELLSLAASSDLVAGVVGWVDLQSGGVDRDLAELQDGPGGEFLRGIRHPVLVEPDPDWLRRPAVLRGLAAVGVAGLCYDLVLPASRLPAAVAAVEACPDVTFVLDHLGNPEISERPDAGSAAWAAWEAWAASIRALAGMGNTFCKLSGILGEPTPGVGSGAGSGVEGGAGPEVGHLVPYYEVVLEAFGPKRLMFGSDWPPCTVSSSYPAVVAAAQALTTGLTADERVEVFSGTARRAYRLDG
jgi:L-fuconolactonase